MIASQGITRAHATVRARVHATVRARGHARAHASRALSMRGKYDEGEDSPVIYSHTTHIHADILPLTWPGLKRLLASAHGVVQL